MKLGGFVDDWKHAWKWFSIQGAAFLAVAPEIYEQVRGMREFIEPNTFHHLMAALGVTVIIGRLIKQEKPEKKESEGDFT